MLLNSITFFSSATTKTCISLLFRPPQTPFALASKCLFYSHLLLPKIPLVQLCHLPSSPPENLSQLHPTTAGVHPLHFHPFLSLYCFAHLSHPAMPRASHAAACPLTGQLLFHHTSALRPPPILSSELQLSPWLQIYTWQSLSQPVFGEGIFTVL